MKERGMIFNSEMVRAILDGRKTQVRIPVKGSAADLLRLQGEHPHKKYNIGCPFGKVGDRIWVRETFRFPSSLDGISPAGVGEMAMAAGYKKPRSPTFYESTGNFGEGWEGFETPPLISNAGKLRPSTHMPRWASRITLEITGVRVERLHDISDEEATAEGVDPETFSYRSPSCGFLDLWESLYGLDNRKSNPWVWVIEFKVVSDE
ncbi:hypothetical protein ACLEDY_05685 [Lonsdalea quercina]|uniref:hypothetical protein n=1 Tax=Lonsdalea quercina TaxID=71657 RepID=UPI003974CC92